MAINDISSRTDILQFLAEFYEKVKRDDTIGIIFTEIVPLNWHHHIPLIADFWETILLDNPLYKANAMEKHFEIHKIYPLEKKHFDRWIWLFNETLDMRFKGPTADLAKKRAKNIADLMKHKMNIEN